MRDREGRQYRIQVHWISSIPENYDNLQSCTVFVHLGDRRYSHNANLDDLRQCLLRAMNSYVECTNFKIASLNNNENFAIAEYGETFI